MVWDMFPSFLELLKASLGHKNVNFNYFSVIHGKKKISCSGATSAGGGPAMRAAGGPGFSLLGPAIATACVIAIAIAIISKDFS